MDLVVVLEYTFFQLCSNTEHKIRFIRFRRSYVSCPAVVLIKVTLIFAWCTLFKVLDVLCSRSFFCSCLSPMVFVEHTCCSNVVDSKVALRGITRHWLGTCLRKRIEGCLPQYVLQSESLQHPLSSSMLKNKIIFLLVISKLMSVFSLMTVQLGEASNHIN